MELVPWRPIGGELTSFNREMDRLWNRLVVESPPARFHVEEWEPSVDISETKDSFVVKAELPGLETKDVNINLSGDLLTLKGEKKKEEKDEDEHHYSTERYYGSFQRVFRLPVRVKHEEVKATFEKGILTITLPKIEEAQKKKIKIKVK